MKIYTCTPVNFMGDSTFFSRDSGLCCRGLQSIDIESMAIMPGKKQITDEKDLIRTDYINLENALWWKSLNINGVVLYSWGDKKYNKVAKAIKDAGLKLFINLDTGGLISPRFNFFITSRILIVISTKKFGSIVGFVLGVLKVIVSLFPFYQDIGRIKHLEYADIIGTLSPIAGERLSSFFKLYGRKDLEKKIRLVPHPVEMKFIYNQEIRKENIILCIGRWDDKIQKRPHLAFKTIVNTLMSNRNYKVYIIGSGTEIFRLLIEKNKNKIRDIIDNIVIVGKVPNDKLVDYYIRAKISLCTSMYESGHIVSEEAICSGCSIVSFNSPYLPSMKYYISNNSGSLCNSSSEEIYETLNNEISEWENGNRNPKEISNFWVKKLHSNSIAIKISNELFK